MDDTKAGGAAVSALAVDTSAEAVAAATAEWQSLVVDWERYRQGCSAEGDALLMACDLIRALAAERDGATQSALDLLATLGRERRAVAAALRVDHEGDLAAEARAVVTERDRLVDLPICRLQLPDGTVPTGTEAALTLWHAAAEDYRSKFEAMREERDALAAQLAARPALSADEARRLVDEFAHACHDRTWAAAHERDRGEWIVASANRNTARAALLTALGETDDAS